MKQGGGTDLIMKYGFGVWFGVGSSFFLSFSPLRRRLGSGTPNHLKHDGLLRGFLGRLL